MPLTGAVTKALFFTCRPSAPGPDHVARPLHSHRALKVSTLRVKDGSVEVARVIVVRQGRHGKVVTERVCRRGGASVRGARAGGAARLRGPSARPPLDTLAMKFSADPLSTGGGTRCATTNAQNPVDSSRRA